MSYQLAYKPICQFRKALLVDGENQLLENFSLSEKYSLDGIGRILRITDGLSNLPGYTANRLWRKYTEPQQVSFEVD